MAWQLTSHALNYNLPYFWPDSTKQTIQKLRILNIFTSFHWFFWRKKPLKNQQIRLCSSTNWRKNVKFLIHSFRIGCWIICWIRWTRKRKLMYLKFRRWDDSQNFLLSHLRWRMKNRVIYYKLPYEWTLIQITNQLQTKFL